MDKYILLFFSFFIINSAAGSSKDMKVVQGTVKSSAGEPLDYVSIYIKNTSYACFSDEEGSFSLEIPAGSSHKLEFSMLGYLSAAVEVSRAETVVHVVLKESAQSLSEVTVLGKSEGRKLKETGLAVNVIEMKEIAVQSVQTNELLDRTAGVRIRQDGGMGSKVNYNINGLSGNAVKIFIDGVPASNYGPAFSLSSIPPALIERIEVYKGVVPGYLSEDALGGAINIILKRRRKNTLASSYSYGSFNTHQWNADGSFRADNGLTFDASVFYNYSDNNYTVWGNDVAFKSPDGGTVKNQRVKRFHDAYESIGGKLNAGFTNVKWADQLLLGAVLSQNYKEQQHGATMQVVYGSRHSRRKSSVFTLNYSKKDFLLKGLSLKADAGWSLLSRQVIDTVGIRYEWNGPIIKPDGSYETYTSGAESGSSKTTAVDRDHSLMARAGLSWRVNDNHTLFANYMFNDFRRKVFDECQPEAVQRLKNTRDLQKNVLAFTYENLAFSARLRTSIFYKRYFQRAASNVPVYHSDENKYKVDVEHIYISHSGAGLTASYALFPDLYLLASAEKALRLPAADELFGNGSENSLPALALKPESSLNANFGFNYGYKINAHAFGINASVYFRDTKDMIREAFSGSKNDYTYAENLEAVLTRGVDAELTYNYAGSISFRFNISRFDVLFNTPYDAAGNPYNYYRMQIRNEPSFKFNGHITYFIRGLFLKGSASSVYYNISYVNEFLKNWSNAGSANLDKIPRQYPMDIGLTYTFPKNKLVFSLDAKNILNQQVFDNFGLQKPGRAFYAKITCFIL